MTATMEEGALDLSTTKLSVDYRSRTPEIHSKEPELSPVPSLGSDGDGHYTTSDTPGGTDRANSSEFSDSRDGHSPMGGTVRPVPGPLPTSYASTAPTSKTSNGMSAGEMPGLPSTLRPFKMYPFEPVPNPSLYPGQMVAPPMSQSMFPGFGGLSPLSPSPVSVLDGAISLSSPITQYLQQRKRRIESRASRDVDPVSPKEKEPRLEMPGPEIKIENEPPSVNHLDIDIRDINTDRKVSCVPDERKDASYWERRRKNNDAAKRSRDSRRAKEEEIALRAAFLEQENLKLRAQVAILKNETAKLHYMLYNRI